MEEEGEEVPAGAEEEPVEEAGAEEAPEEAGAEPEAEGEEKPTAAEEEQIPVYTEGEFDASVAATSVALAITLFLSGFILAYCCCWFFDELRWMWSGQKQQIKKIKLGEKDSAGVKIRKALKKGKKVKKFAAAEEAAPLPLAPERAPPAEAEPLAEAPPAPEKPAEEKPAEEKPAEEKTETPQAEQT